MPFVRFYNESTAKEEHVMNRLRYYLAILVGLCVAGTVLIAPFTLGYYTITAFIVAALLGLLTAWPGGVWMARWIKRDDPAWDHRRDKAKPF
jgi:hypothetical protein